MNENDDSEVVEENEGLYEYLLEEENDEEAYNALAVLGTYDGQRNSDNERHGFGKAILPNGDAYVGSYKNGLRHGHGVYKFKNGASYKGCYKEGLRNGKGVMHYPDKTKYEGQWTDNERDGEGVYTFKNDDKYSGFWKSNKKHGAGTYTFCRSRAVLTGTWHDDRRVNNFHVFFPTGSEGRGYSFYGTWDDDDDQSVAGEGYFVFENVKCMQKGVHVENQSCDNGDSVRDNGSCCGSTWVPTDIMPIVRGMLPLPQKTQTSVYRRSSCEIVVPSEQAFSESFVDEQLTSSSVEAYEHRDDLWNDLEEKVEHESDVVEEARPDSASNLEQNQKDEDIQRSG